jgi:hypothetical protein
VTRQWIRRLAVSTAAAGFLVALASKTVVAAPVCDDHLVTHQPDGSTGDTSAVAITSQAIERDTPGWAHAGWSAGPDTAIREVVAERAEGTVRLPGTATGSVEDALALSFCGTVAGAEVDPPAGARPSPSVTSPKPETEEDPAAPESGSGTAISTASTSDPAAEPAPAPAPSVEPERSERPETATADEDEAAVDARLPADPPRSDPRSTADWRRANLGTDGVNGAGPSADPPTTDARPIAVPLLPTASETSGVPALPGITIGTVLAAVVVLVSRGNRVGVSS